MMRLALWQDVKPLLLQLDIDAVMMANSTIRTAMVRMRFMLQLFFGLAFRPGRWLGFGRSATESGIEKLMVRWCLVQWIVVLARREPEGLAHPLAFACVKGFLGAIVIRHALAQLSDQLL